MIFKVPPYDPREVLLGETDFMLWMFDAENHVSDEINILCMKEAEKYFNKNFVQVMLGCAKTFCSEYNLYLPKMVIRVKDSKVLWNSYLPRSHMIKRQAKLLECRKGGIRFDSIPLQNLESIHPRSKQSSVRLKRYRDSLRGFFDNRLARFRRSRRSDKSNADFEETQESKTLPRNFTIPLRNENDVPRSKSLPTNRFSAISLQKNRSLFSRMSFVSSSMKILRASQRVSRLLSRRSEMSNNSRVISPTIVLTQDKKNSRKFSLQSAKDSKRNKETVKMLTCDVRNSYPGSSIESLKTSPLNPQTPSCSQIKIESDLKTKELSLQTLNVNGANRLSRSSSNASTNLKIEDVTKYISLEDVKSSPQPLQNGKHDTPKISFTREKTETKVTSKR